MGQGMTPPIWQEIRTALTADINARRTAPGDKLPTEAELARRFGVNRHTVRRALAAMREDGLVHARRGAGVFVKASPVAYRLGRRTRFTQNLSETGHTGRREILRLETAQATREEAQNLGLAKGAEVHVLENVAVIDDVPATHSHSLFPAGRMPGFCDAMRETGSITAALKASGIADYRRAWTRIGAERASPMIARHLHISDGAPLIRTLALNADAEGRPVEYARTLFCADRVELLVDEEGFG